MKWFDAGTKKLSVSPFGSFIKLMKLQCTASWVSPRDRWIAAAAAGHCDAVFRINCASACSHARYAASSLCEESLASSCLREPSVQNARILWYPIVNDTSPGTAPLEIKTNNNRFFNSNDGQRQTCWFFTASHCFHWDLETNCCSLFLQPYYVDK